MNEWSRLALVTPPTDQAVSLPEAKRHMRYDAADIDQDEFVQSLILAAEAFLSGPNGIGIALCPQTWRLSLDYFPREIVIPMGPITSIDAITYTDANGNAATVSSWRSDLDSQPVRIWPARDSAWPSVVCGPGAVKVTFTCGFTTVPPDLKHAILLLVSHFNEHREAALDTGAKFGLVELPFGVQSILERYRVGRVA